MEKLATHCNRVQGQLDRRKVPVRFGKDKANPRDLAEIIYRMISVKEATYIGPKRIQCSPNRLRSIQDIYNVTKTYITGISYQYLYEVMNQTLKGIVISHFCNTVKRNVFYVSSMAYTKHTFRDKLGDKNKLVKI